jgi:hypothetical protein
VQGKDVYGNSVQVRGNWSVIGDLGRIDPGSGRFTPLKSGTGWVVVEAEGLRDSVVVVVPRQPEQVYNYPNPVWGDETNFRYYLNGPAEISIELYDLSGDFITSLPPHWEERGLGWREMTWKLSGMASGVYLYQCSVSYGDRKVDLPVKKMVIIR